MYEGACCTDAVCLENPSLAHTVLDAGEIFTYTHGLGRSRVRERTRTTQDTTLRRRHHRAVVRRRPGRPLSVWPPRRLLPNVVHVVSQSVVSAAAVVIAVVAVAVAVAGVLVVVAILARRGGWSTRLGRLRHGLDRSRARDDRRSVGEKWVFRKGKVKNFLKREVFFSMNRAREERQ